MRSGKQLDVAFVDFAKAFDKVKLPGLLSQEFHQFSGVPQGSLLGPYLFIVFINDLTSILQVEALLFADDVKIFTAVSNQEDSVRLQSSINSVLDWCNTNNMKLNFSKCSVMTFSRLNSPHHFHYTLDGKSLERVFTIKDLGVTFNSDLSFSDHVHDICRRSHKMLGFIARTTRGMTSPTVLRTLFSSFVRQLLEYASPVWSPHQLGLTDKLEAVQRKFLRLVGMRQGLRWREVPVAELQASIHLPDLQVRRETADLLFLVKLINGLLDCPELLSQVDFRIPVRTRSLDLFVRRHYSTSYDFNSPLARMMRLGNHFSHTLDFFHDSTTSVRRNVLDGFVYILCAGCQILLGRNNMFRYNDPVEAEKLRKEGYPSSLNLSRLSLLSWSTNDLTLSQSSESLQTSFEETEKSGKLKIQRAELLKEKEAFKQEQAEKEQDWEKEQQIKREALELAQKQLEQERQQMEEAFEAQCKRLAEDWQKLEQHQAQNLATLRHKEAELDKNRQLLQCEKDEEIAAITVEHKALEEVKQCIDSKKKEFKEFVAAKIQEILCVNNNFMLPDENIKPLSVLAAEKFCEGLCWMDMTFPPPPTHPYPHVSSPLSPLSWSSLTSSLKEGIVGEIISHHKAAISKMEIELNSRAQSVAQREEKVRQIDEQLLGSATLTSSEPEPELKENQIPATDATAQGPVEEDKADVTKTKQRLRLDLVPAAPDLTSSPETFHTAGSPSPVTMSDSGVGLGRGGYDSDEVSSTDDSCKHQHHTSYRLRFLYNKMKHHDKCEDQNLSKTMKLLMQKITRQRLHIIRSLESDLDQIDTNQEISLLQDLKREYVRLEKKLEERGKENIRRNSDDSEDASTSTEETNSLCDTIKLDSTNHIAHNHTRHHMCMSTQELGVAPLCCSSTHLRMMQDRRQGPLSPLMNFSVSSQFMDHIPPYNYAMARSMPSLNPSYGWESSASEGLVVRVPTYVLRGAGSSTHYAYEVRVSLAGECWAILRRYSRFRELHLQMKQKYGPKVAALNLPPRRLFSRNAEWLAQERRPQLERYLQSLLQVIAQIPGSPLYSETSKAALLELSPFFRRGVFETSKYGTS